MESMAIIKYNPKNKVVLGLLNVLSEITKVQVIQGETLTAEEFKKVRKSEKSGLGSIEELKQILKK